MSRDIAMRHLIRQACARTKDMKPRRAETDRDIRARMNIVVVRGILNGEETITMFGGDYHYAHEDVELALYALGINMNPVSCLGPLIAPFP